MEWFSSSLTEIGQNYVKWFIAANARRVAGKSYDPSIGCLLLSATPRDELSYFFTPSSLVVHGFMSREQHCKCIVCRVFLEIFKMPSIRSFGFIKLEVINLILLNKIKKNCCTIIWMNWWALWILTKLLLYKLGLNFLFIIFC